MSILQRALGLAVTIPIAVGTYAYVDAALLTAPHTPLLVGVRAGAHASAIVVAVACIYVVASMFHDATTRRRDDVTQPTASATE